MGATGVRVAAPPRMQQEETTKPPHPRRPTTLPRAPSPQPLTCPPVPYPERVQANFKAWLAQHGQPFTPNQRHWLEMIRDHIAANLGIDIEDFSYAPFEQEGGLGKVYQLFGAELPVVISSLNHALAA
jgi:hypothetical protein